VVIVFGARGQAAQARGIRRFWVPMTAGRFKRTERADSLGVRGMGGMRPRSRSAGDAIQVLGDVFDQDFPPLAIGAAGRPRRDSRAGARTSPGGRSNRRFFAYAKQREQLGADANYQAISVDARRLATDLEAASHETWKAAAAPKDTRRKKSNARRRWRSSQRRTRRTKARKGYADPGVGRGYRRGRS